MVLEVGDYQRKHHSYTHSPHGPPLNEHMYPFLSASHTKPRASPEAGVQYTHTEGEGRPRDGKKRSVLSLGCTGVSQCSTSVVSAV